MQDQPLTNRERHRQARGTKWENGSVSTISALLANSLCWDNAAISRLAPPETREEIAQESRIWQQLSQNGAQAEGYAYPLPFRREHIVNGVVHVIPPRTGKPPREPNRLLELHGLMGAIGEQLGLAWTIELDIQRMLATAESRTPEHQRVVQRALAESAAYFLLGASHSLANLVLRLLLVNREAAATIVAWQPRANGFRPLSDDRFAWVSLDHTVGKRLAKSASASTNQSMADAVEAIRVLQRSRAFRDLDERRGMDYHRRRPQSLQHASPRKEAMRHEPTQSVFTMFGAQLEPEADADRVHDVVLAATTALFTAMTAVRQLIPEAIRAEGINFITS
jgi:hypothetical protein